jgi:hypothetical protein
MVGRALVITLLYSAFKFYDASAQSDDVLSDTWLPRRNYYTDSNPPLSRISSFNFSAHPTTFVFKFLMGLNAYKEYYRLQQLVLL